MKLVILAFLLMSATAHADDEWQVLSTTDEGCDGTYQFSVSCTEDGFVCDSAGNNTGRGDGANSKVELNCYIKTIERNQATNEVRAGRSLYHLCDCITR